MGHKFAIFIVTVSILQTSLCILNVEASRKGRQNRFPDGSQSEENALDYNTREGEPSTNFDIESFKNQLASLSPQQMQQVVDLMAPGKSSEPRVNGNNADEMIEGDSENSMMNARNDRMPNRRRGRRNGRRNGRRRDGRGRDGCNRNGERRNGAGMGYGVGRGSGNGQGYGRGIGYGSGGNGDGIGFGAGQGYGAGRGMGAGNGYGPRTGSGRGIGRGFGGAGGNFLSPYEYGNSPSTPSVSGTEGAMIGGGSEISGVKINTLARPTRNGIPSRMASGQDRPGLNTSPAQLEDQGMWLF